MVVRSNMLRLPHRSLYHLALLYLPIFIWRLVEMNPKKTVLTASLKIPSVKTLIYIVRSELDTDSGPMADYDRGIFDNIKSAEAALDKAKKEDPYDHHEICIYELNDQGEYKIVKGETE